MARIILGVKGCRVEVVEGCRGEVVMLLSLEMCSTIAAPEFAAAHMSRSCRGHLPVKSRLQGDDSEVIGAWWGDVRSMVIGGRERIGVSSSRCWHIKN